MGRYCENCGHELKAGAKFCPKCGKKIEVDEVVVEKSEMPDSQRLEEIYTSTYAKAYSVAIQMVKNKEDALDILQESYISAFKNINSLRDTDKAGAWINRIVANRCLDWMRKKNRNKQMLFTEMLPEDTDLEFEDSLENDNQEFMPEESVDYEATKKIMQDILANLSDDQRLCVLMYYYDELSVSEIAETLDCSAGTIKSRLNYARKYIKKEVEELEKKGTKLYGIAPIPFIVWMLTSQEHTITAEALGISRWTEIKNAVDNLQNNSHVQGAETQVSNRKATEKIVDYVAKETAKKGTKHIVTKVVAGIVAASVVGAGAYVGYSKINTEPVKATEQQEVNEKEDVSEKQGEKQVEEKKQENVPEFTVSDEQIEEICSAAEWFNNGKITEDESYFQGDDYTLTIKKGEISPDIIDYVASRIACADPSIGDELGEGRKSMKTTECQEFLMNTFEYEANDWIEVSKVFAPSGNSRAEVFEARCDDYAEAIDAQYKVARLSQTDTNEYHFYVEVSSLQNAYEAGMMDITAHNNGVSKIGGFVFDKIVYTSGSNTGKINHDIGLIIGNMIRATAEGEEDGNAYNPIRTYSINDLTSDEFVNLANRVFTNSQYIAQDREMQKDEYGVYAGYSMNVKEYEKLCKETLGRIVDYNFNTIDKIEGKNIIYAGKSFDATELWFGVENAYMIQSMDGTVKIYGTIKDYKVYPDEKFYSFTASVHEDEKSELGMIIDKVEVLEEVETPIGEMDSSIQ